MSTPWIPGKPGGWGQAEHGLLLSHAQSKNRGPERSHSNRSWAEAQIQPRLTLHLAWFFSGLGWLWGPKGML